MISAASEVKALRRHAYDLRAQVRADTTEFVLGAWRAGVPIRDIAYLLGLCHQRISQIIIKANKATS